MRVAIQGERGSFSHEAALQMLQSGKAPASSPSVDIIPCALSPEVFEKVATGTVDCAVVPIENSLAGSVLEHYDLLLAHPVRIASELLLRIEHHLIVPQGTSLSNIREVYSHPVALAQCRNFFAANPSVRAMPFYDTAGAAAHAVSSHAGIGAIGSKHAASEYGGQVLLAGIEDHQKNYTRFLLLHPAAAANPATNPSRPADKVSLAFAVANQPGSLVAALAIFARHGLNLTRLESRPVPGSPWEYVFYTDYQLAPKAAQDQAADHALAELAASCLFVKELGRYLAAS